MTRIFIEDYELDIDKGLSNRITYAVDDLQNLDSKSTPFTKTIILPGTANNNNLLGNIFEFNNSNFTFDALPNVLYNFNASKSAKCRIEVNGLSILKGVFRLLEIIVDGDFVEYECFIVGDAGGLVAKLGNSKLTDLDFSAYDHVYTVANITASWDNANTGTSYYYPLVDYGNVSLNKKDFQYKAFRPALHVREYIDKIITNAGYSWESSFFDTDFFKRLIIPNNSKSLLVAKNQQFYTTANPSYSLNKTFPSGQNTDTTVDDISFPAYVGTNFTTSDNKEFTYIGGNASLNFNTQLNGGFFIFANFSFQSVYLKIEIIKNGNVVYYNGQTYGRSGYGSGTFVANINTVLTLDTNDVISFRITTTGYRPLTIISNSYGSSVTGSSLTIDSAVPILTPAELNDTIRFNEIQPKNILQKDFLTSILKMFNLMITSDNEHEKKLLIEPYVNFYDTTPPSYLDWNSKIDYGKQIRLKPMSELNARYYNFKYKPDADFYNENYSKKYNEGYGDRIFDNNFEFSKESQNLEVIFSNSVLTGFAGEDKIYPSIFKKNNALENPIDHNIRIMQAKKVTGVASWDILNLATVLSSNTTYPYAGHLDDPDAPNADLCFGVPFELQFALVSGNLSNNLFNAYYSSYMAEITDKDSRVLSIMVKLGDADIHNLDFSKFVYINGGLYRLQKLIDYAPGENETTKAEFLRVIYTTY